MKRQVKSFEFGLFQRFFAALFTIVQRKWLVLLLDGEFRCGPVTWNFELRQPEGIVGFGIGLRVTFAPLVDSTLSCHEVVAITIHIILRLVASRSNRFRTDNLFVICVTFPVRWI